MRSTGILLSLLVIMGAGASSICQADFTFWGIEMGQSTYVGPSQLSFTDVRDGIQYAVGGTSYTGVNGLWYGPFDPPSPGFGYDEYPAFDAQAAFFFADADYAHFALIGGMDPGGVTFADGGYGDREFGPGDLYLSIGGQIYGVGVRPGGLYWVDGDNAQFRIYRADTGGQAGENVRDAGTIGAVELNPIWYHVDHAGLAPSDPTAYSFFGAGSGTLSGSALVNVADTGVKFGNYDSYLYEVAIPWSALGFAGKPKDTAISFHWGPDCGNDLLSGTFMTPVPEPQIVQLAGLLLGIGGLGIARLRK